MKLLNTYHKEHIQKVPEKGGFWNKNSSGLNVLNGFFKIKDEI